jgi:hypothetical protein
MLALRFIEPDHQGRMTYKLEGRKKIDGVQVYGIGFKENREERKVYLLDTPDNPWCSGRIWIEPATGAIHLTELWVQSDTAVARVQVTYAMDAKINLLVPRDATHTFEMHEKGTGMTNMGAGGAGLGMTFESSAKYTNAQFTPLDLSKIGK